MLKLEAARNRTEISRQREAYIENLKIEEQRNFENQQKELTLAREKAINQAIASFDKIDNVYGIPVSQSDKADFRNTFQYLVTPDKDGISPIVKALQSDEELAKFAFIYSKGNSKIREAINSAKEGAKKAWKEKLDPEPSIKKTQGSDSSGEIDFDKLSAPAQN